MGSEMCIRDSVKGGFSMMFKEELVKELEELQERYEAELSRLLM